MTTSLCDVLLATIYTGRRFLVCLWIKIDFILFFVTWRRYSDGLNRTTIERRTSVLWSLCSHLDVKCPLQRKVVPFPKRSVGVGRDFRSF